ncbi:MAG: alpha-L-rhamnosidase C-terminal domain-containing protein, partial [Verrucomicrobiota bacterium]
QFQRYLIDFGTTVVGSLGLQIQGAVGGEVVDTLHVETIDESTLTPDYILDRHCRMAFSHRLTCRAGENNHFFYHIFGFRYVVIAVRNIKSNLSIRPSLRTAIYPLDIQGRFKSSDENLTQIWEICAHTQRCCSLDAFVDTPWREQAQWWGDARVQVWNTFHLANDDRLLRRGIQSIAAQKTPEGLTYGHAPTMAHNCILPDFSLIWILTVWDHYWQTGSAEMCDTHEETILSLLNYFKNTLHPKLGLVQYDPRYWLFLDWTDLHKEGCPTLLNLWLLEALDKLTILWTRNKKALLAKQARTWALRLRKALKPLINRDGLIRDGYDSKGKMVQEASVHNQILALMTKLNPPSKQKMIEERLLPSLRNPSQFKAQPSAYWITYLFSVLQENDHISEVIQSIRKHWSPMIPHGTTWENFSPKRGEWSFSHAWSSHPLYHFMQTIGGIRQTSPQWKSIDFHPHFEGSSAETIIPTPMGKIESRWEKVGNKIKVSLQIPKNVEATIILPGIKKYRTEKSFSREFLL